MKVRKALITVIGMLCLIGNQLFASGTGESATNVSTTKQNEKLNIKMIMVGGKSKDTDLVLARVNEELLKRVNATIELEYIGWADWQTKYQLLFAGGEDFDAIFAADWAMYGTMARKNAYLEITEDLIKKNAPNIYKSTPKAAWDQVKINGKIFMLPQLRDEFNQRHWIIRGDLRKKYNLPQIKSVNDIEMYLDTLKKNEPGIPGIVAQPSNHAFYSDIMVRQPNGYATAGGNPIFEYAVYSITNPKDNKLTNILDLPAFIEYLKTIRRWNENGYIAKNILSNTTGGKDLIQNGQTALFVQNLGTANAVFSYLKKNQPTWSVEVYDGTYGKPVLAYPHFSGGLAINARSKKAERILQIADILRYDEELNNLVQRGIKGKHWDIAPNQSNRNVIVALSGDYNDSFAWGPWRNDMYQEQPSPEDAIPGYHALFNDLKKRTVKHPLQAFVFDDTNVKSELAAIKAVAEQYYYPLVWGFVDPVSGLNDIKAKFKQAGFDKVFEEMQKQVDAFMNTMK